MGQLLFDEIYKLLTSQIKDKNLDLLISNHDIHQYE